jgi:hypothetical protein
VNGEINKPEKPAQQLNKPEKLAQQLKPEKPAE